MANARERAKIKLTNAGPGNDRPPAKRAKHLNKPVVEDTEAKWRHGYHWARRTGTDKKGHAIMCCQLCGKHQPHNKWATQGVIVHDESALKQHESSVSHVRSLEQEAGSTGLARAAKNVCCNFGLQSGQPAQKLWPCRPLAAIAQPLWHDGWSRSVCHGVQFWLRHSLPVTICRHELNMCLSSCSVIANSTTFAERCFKFQNWLFLEAIWPQLYSPTSPKTLVSHSLAIHDDRHEANV